MHRFQIFLPEPLIKRLKALSKKADLSVAELIRRAVEQYLRDEK